MKIKPIRTEVDYEAALSEIERLFNAEPGTPDGDDLDVLAVLVEAYENEHYLIPLPGPIEAIEYHMERLNLTRKDLESYLGGPSRVSEVLNRKRPLNLRMIRSLSAGLGIPIDVLAQPYELREAAPEFDAGFFPFFVGTTSFDFSSINSSEDKTPLVKSPFINVSQFLTKPNYQKVGYSDLISKPEPLFAGNVVNATERTIQ